LPDQKSVQLEEFADDGFTDGGHGDVLIYDLRFTI
jgi:hypothetical protein